MNEQPFFNPEVEAAGQLQRVVLSLPLGHVPLLRGVAAVMHGKRGTRGGAALSGRH